MLTNLSVGVTAGVHDRAGRRAMVLIAGAFLMENPTSTPPAGRGPALGGEPVQQLMASAGTIGTDQQPLYDQPQEF